jgi:hypothetical protein
MIVLGDSGYACRLWRDGGATPNTCTNSLTVKRAIVETQLITVIQERLFTEEGLKEFTREFERYLREERHARSSQSAHAQVRLAEVEREISHITTAIKAGIITPTTKAMLIEAESEREKLKQTLQGPTLKPNTLTMRLPNMMSRFRQMLDDLVKASRYEIDKARGMLAAMVGEKKIILRPTTDQRGRYYIAELAGDYAGLIPLVFQGHIKVVAVTRIERVTRG